MSNAQMPIGQDFAADDEAPEQPHGPSALMAGANGLVGHAVMRRLVAQS